MGSVALPEMKRFKYDPRLATGLVAAGGTVGSLIPPSGVLIIYGILTQTSIGKLFLGGWIPGIMEVVSYMIVIYLLCRFNPLLGPRGESFSFKEKFFAFLNAGEAIGLILFVLLGLMVGWFTPTEAGAVGAVGALAFSLIRKRLTWVALKSLYFHFTHHRYDLRHPYRGFHFQLFSGHNPPSDSPIGVCESACITAVGVAGSNHVGLFCPGMLS